MKSFFKTIGLGALYLVTLPFTILFLALYAVYCLLAFIYISFRSLITFFSGGTPLGDLPEDVEAKRILMQQEASKEAMAAAYAGTMAQMATQQQVYQQQPQPFYQQPQQAPQQPVFNMNPQPVQQPQPAPQPQPEEFKPAEPVQQVEPSVEAEEESYEEGEDDDISNNG